MLIHVNDESNSCFCLRVIYESNLCYINSIEILQGQFSGCHFLILQLMQHKICDSLILVGSCQSTMFRNVQFVAFGYQILFWFLENSEIHCYAQIILLKLLCVVDQRSMVFLFSLTVYVSFLAQIEQVQKINGRLENCTKTQKYIKVNQILC